VGSGKSTGSIAYKSNVTHSIEPTCAQVQRQQQALLLLATALRADTDICTILAALLSAGKKNLAECDNSSKTSACAAKKSVDAGERWLELFRNEHKSF
jgi:hypothetical protein